MKRTLMLTITLAVFVLLAKAEKGSDELPLVVELSSTADGNTVYKVNSKTVKQADYGARLHKEFAATSAINAVIICDYTTRLDTIVAAREILMVIGMSVRVFVVDHETNKMSEIVFDYSRIEFSTDPSVLARQIKTKNGSK